MANILWRPQKVIINCEFSTCNYTQCKILHRLYIMAFRLSHPPVSLEPSLFLSSFHLCSFLPLTLSSVLICFYKSLSYIFTQLLSINLLCACPITTQSRTCNITQHASDPHPSHPPEPSPPPIRPTACQNRHPPPSHLPLRPHPRL